ncbi:MAG TPA: YhzD family protein [Pseudogracilibacillus sp.]|nr:YhzD family protein [Pseudogracilibacillus sp.]
MKEYALTVFSKKGEKLLDEVIEAENDDQAKKLGKTKLQENNYEEHTHRCVSPTAKLVLFHR